MLYFVGDPDAREAAARFTSITAPGSSLVPSQVNSEPDPRAVAAGTAVYASTANLIMGRICKEILGFFGGLEILEPGLVPVTQWRPDEPSLALAGR